MYDGSNKSLKISQEISYNFIIRILIMLTAMDTEKVVAEFRSNNPFQYYQKIKHKGPSIYSMMMLLVYLIHDHSSYSRRVAARF